MDVQPPDKRTIFEHALEFAFGAEREAYLEDACAGKAEMRAQVDSLLKAHNDVGSFLDGPAFDAQRTAPMEPISEQPGTIIGPYKLLEQIGEGGFGVVFMAEQERPIRRRVALKVIKPGMDTRQVIARFEAERQALALMDHPKIAHVLDAGATDSGRPYFVMELVRGIPITDFCDQNRLAVDERLKLFAAVCHAVQHAHQKGIIHRDIKPTNVLVTLHDGEPVPKVIDFGVAKATGQRLTDKTLFTAFAQMIGTPLYMSPEQTEMSGLDVDTRSDTYSLGVMLYELLTGTTPLDKERLQQAAYDEIRRIIREEDPPKPSTRISTLGATATAISTQRKSDPGKLGSLVRGELDWIVMKCLEKDRNRRYETPNGLARDIEHYLRNETVEACPPSAAYRLHKFVHRNRGPVITASLVTVCLLVGMIGFAWQSAQTLRQKVIADEARQQADDRAMEAERQKQLVEKEKARAEKTLYDASILAAARAIDAARYDQARQLLNDCPIDRRNWEWGRLLYLCNLDLMTIRAHTGAARTAAFNPDGSVIASGGDDKAVKIFFAETGQEVRQLTGHGERVNALAFSPSGKLLATGCGSDKGSTDNSVRLWNPATGQLLATLVGHSGKVCALAFSPDGRCLASGGADRQIILWDVEAQREQRRLVGHTGQVLGVAFHPDGEILASAGWVADCHVNVWNVRDGSLVKVLDPGDSWGLTCVAFNHDGSVLAAGGKENAVRRWKTADFSSMRALNSWILMSSLAYHPKRDEIAIACNDNAFILAGAQTDKEQLRTLEGPQGEACSTSYDRDGNRLLVAYGDGTLRVFDANRMDASSIGTKPRVPGVWPYVSTVAVSSDGATIATAISEDRYARVWDSGSASARLVLGPHPEAVSSVAITPDGTQLVTTSDRPRIWDLKTLKSSLLNGATGNDRYCAALDGQGKLLAIAATAGAVKLWSMQTRKVLRTLQGKHGIVTRVALNPNGTIAATVESKTVVLWDTNTGKPLRDLGPEAHGVRSLAFSPDGRLLVTGGDITPMLWDVSSGKLVGRCVGHSDHARAVAFSPDGRRLATVSPDHTFRVWDVDSQRELLSGQARSALYAVAFSRDGRFLLTGGYGPHLNIWPSLPWDAAAYPIESAARDDAVEVQKRKYWRSYAAARDAAPKPTTVSIQFEQTTADERKKAPAAAGSIPLKPKSERELRASALNSQAWTLATHSDSQKRDPRRAVELAKEAVELSPKDADLWNTLGVAQYRDGNWRDAISTLQKYRELRTNDAEYGNPFFLAMAHWRMGNEDEARRWYDTGVGWMDKHAFTSESLKRFRSEATELLGVNEKK